MPIVEHLIRPDESQAVESSTSSSLVVLKVLSALASYSNAILSSLGSEMASVEQRIHNSTVRVNLFLNQRIPFLEQSRGRSLKVNF